LNDFWEYRIDISSKIIGMTMILKFGYLGILIYKVPLIIKKKYFTLLAGTVGENVY